MGGLLETSPLTVHVVLLSLLNMNFLARKEASPCLRHNEIMDLTANVLSEVCHDVCIEPVLQPLTGEVLSGASAIREDAARLDIAADGFWGDTNLTCRDCLVSRC